MLGVGVWLSYFTKGENLSLQSRLNAEGKQITTPLLTRNSSYSYSHA